MNNNLPIFLNGYSNNTYLTSLEELLSLNEINAKAQHSRCVLQIISYYLLPLILPLLLPA
jgi:hypothetical protein